jgi:hypothetical protein
MKMMTFIEYYASSEENPPPQYRIWCAAEEKRLTERTASTEAAERRSDRMLDG